MHNSPETTPGGRALKFYSSIRLDIRRIEAIKDGADVIGNRTRVKVVKNKCSAPFKQAEFDIMYGKGISREGSLLDVALDLGFVKKSGAWFTYEGEQLGQGRENVKTFLSENPQLMAEIDDRVRDRLAPKEDADSLARRPAHRPRRPPDRARRYSRLPGTVPRLSRRRSLRAGPPTSLEVIVRSCSLAEARVRRPAATMVRCRAGDGSNAPIRVLRPAVPTVPFRYLPPKQSVRLAFNVILDREPDHRRRSRLHQQAGRRRAVPPRRGRGAGPFRGVPPPRAHRQRAALHARQPERVRGRAAPGGRILDLGGTHQGLPDGALVHLGYPYPFERLVVVDLPVEERDEIYQGGSTGEPVLSELGPVEFAFHSMVDLGRYADGSFDLVYSGQSIEHVSEADGDTVVREAFRVLAPGGWFCLDTPNGPVWRLRSDELMNHDHEVEYGAGELVAKLERGRLRGHRVQGPQPHAARRGGGRVRRGRGQRAPRRVRGGRGLPVAGGGGPQAGVTRASDAPTASWSP